MSDAFSAQLATATVGLLHVLMACAAWLMLRGPRQAQAVQLWATGALVLGVCLASGGLAHPLPPQVPEAMRDLLLPGLLLGSMLLRVLALRRHMGRPLRLGTCTAMAAGVAVGWAVSLQSADPRVPASYANAVLILGTAIIGQHAWEDSRTSGAPTARWVAWAEWALTAALVLRALAFASAPPEAGRWDWWAVVAAAAVAALFGNLGFLGMVLDDMHRAELQARQAQIDETASREAAEQTAQELQTLLAQRDELAEERESLLQVLAHEIRQPLHSAGLAMQGAVQVLRNPRSASATEVGAQLMQAQMVLGDVRSVLDNILAAATLLSRGMPLVRQDVALDFIVELTMGDLGARQLERLTVDWRTGVDTLEVEPGLVRLALRNLLINAFAHGGPGVQVRLCVDELPASNSLRLVVADDGPGITPAQLRDPAPLPGQPARRRLGLTIVRQVMDLHGGQLVLGNALPRGFAAQLVFPLPADDWEMDDDLAEALVGTDDGPATVQAGSSGARNT
ncbi:MAG: ATP-binding protein [Aquabacterium sp.]|nr:ATP-binding protein [Aquabacterium sp.]